MISGYNDPSRIDITVPDEKVHNDRLWANFMTGQIDVNSQFCTVSSLSNKLYDFN